MNQELRNLLNKKYGNQIVSELLTSDDRLNIDKIRSNGLGQEMVKNQMKKLTEEKLIDLDVVQSQGEWAFDFPGWIGKFAKGEKEVMIVGLEPHIQENDFQIAYSFGEKETGEFVQNHFITDRIHALIYPKLPLEKALKKLYITDLCHFSPKGNANKIAQVPNWAKIRSDVAEKYLKKEIEVVSPKVILAQGKNTFLFLKKQLNLKVKTDFVATGYARPTKYGIYFSDYQGVKIIGIPHIGSVFNLIYGFWEKKLLKVRELIINEIQI